MLRLVQRLLAATASSTSGQIKERGTTCADVGTKETVIVEIESGMLLLKGSFVNTEGRSVNHPLNRAAKLS